MNVKPTYEELEQKVKVLEELLAKSKQVEETLKDTEKLYRLLFNHSPNGVLIIDPETARFLALNETACLQLGYSREEFSKLSIFDLEADQTPEEIRAHIADVIKCGMSVFETRHRTKQGNLRNIHVTAQYTEALRKPVFHCIWHDITEYREAEKALQKAYDELEIRVRERTADIVKTNNELQKEISERKRAEAILKDNEKKFAGIFYKSAIPMAITAMKDGRYIDVNEAFMKVMGLKREELVGSSSTGAGYISSESRALFLKEYNQKGFVANLELPMRVKDGKWRRGLFNSTKIILGNEEFFLTMVTDITELRRMQEELRRYREELEILVAERTKELEDKTRNLQEINTTLNVILQKREEDKKLLEDRFIANIGNLVLPYVEKIRKNNLDEQQKFCLDTIERNLDEIASPLLKNIQQFNLTPREIQIAALIKDGKTTKEIAKTLGIGEGSIDTHRKNIRKKLGLDRASNLQSHLCFLE
ncbi:MAG: PAS domain S-box protein [Smithella sp.]